MRLVRWACLSALVVGVACGGEEFTAGGSAGAAGQASGGSAGSGASSGGGASATGGTGAAGSGATGAVGGGATGGTAGATSCGECVPPANCLGNGVCEVAVGVGAEYPSLGPTRVYWSTSTGLSAALRDGSDHPGSEIITVGADSEGTTVLGSRVFLAARDVNEIRSSDLAGGNDATVVTGASGPQEVAGDATHLYFTDRYSGSVKRVVLGGNTPETVAQGYTEPRALALDATNVFFSSSEGLFACPKAAACTATKLVDAFATLPGTWSSSTLVATDGARLYWLLDNAVASVSKAGGSVTEHAAAGDTVEGLAVAGGYVYWGTSTTPSAVRRRPVDNGMGPQDLVTSEGPIRGIAVDPTQGVLFFVVRTDATTGACSIRKLPLPS